MKFLDYYGKFYTSDIHDGTISEFTKNKKKSRELAKDLNIPVPDEIKLDYRKLVLKKHYNLHNGQGVFILDNPKDYILEVLVKCHSGNQIALTYMCFVINKKVQFFQVGKFNIIEDDILRKVKRESVAYFDKDWNNINFIADETIPELKVEKPKKINILIEYAEKIASKLDIEFCRVDFFIGLELVFFNEIMFQPNLIKRINSKGNMYLGKIWSESLDD